jgi:hypothetical protein
MGHAMPPLHSSVQAKDKLSGLKLLFEATGMHGKSNASD